MFASEIALNSLCIFFGSFASNIIDDQMRVRAEAQLLLISIRQKGVQARKSFFVRQSRTPKNTSLVSEYLESRDYV